MHTDQAHSPNSKPKQQQTKQTASHNATTAVADYKTGIARVIRRNGKPTVFERSKILVAMSKAFLAVEGGNSAASSRVHDVVENLTTEVISALKSRLMGGDTVHIEHIQDQVELALMRHGEQKVARAYVLYREQHAQQRQLENIAVENISATVDCLQVSTDDGGGKSFEYALLNKIIATSSKGLTHINKELIETLTIDSLYDGIGEDDVYLALIMSARSLIDSEPEYSKMTARLLLHNLKRQAISYLQLDKNQSLIFEFNYVTYFKAYIEQAVSLGLLDKQLLDFDLDRLSEALNLSSDQKFEYLGLQTLADRYFIHHDELRFELPQAFFMRVAMGLASQEINREEQAIQFYQLLSSFDFMSSTPTLFNSATNRPQLSSCYLTTVPDDLEAIYGSLKDNAMLSKYAGGLGNDWSRVRGLGAYIKGTNGKSQGIVPFLKVANDTAVAVNQGGKRKGAMCAYLETWHIDIEEFLDLRKNTGDDRRRTHDMNTANWIPDLFMKRVVEEKDWTLFSPEQAPELHELYGKEFEKAYIELEKKAQAGEIKLSKQVSALELWRKMLSMLFETGHPWITFKDPCNVRYTNKHKGVVHSSNLCTEITLHTNDNEIAVCNLGSINLVNHITKDGTLDLEKLEKTIKIAIRMLDNVVDYNYYAVPQARHSNLQHRPIGLGLMGFQDALYLKNIAYNSEQAVAFADYSMEAISYYAIQASTDLAVERGQYSTYQGSLWSQGILPIDSNNLLLEQRGNYLDINKEQTLDWNKLRKKVLKQGMRNSNCLAIAPTATISNICGVSQSIEPTYQNVFVKSNLSGEFTVLNHYLVKALKARDLWDDVMINDLKYYDGSVINIDRIPDDLKVLFMTAFEIDARWLIEAAARRQKWIDQAQSLNLYLAEPSGKKLDQLYKLAWIKGLKTTYYLRSLAATQMEKNTSHNNKIDAPACSILDPECEACQ